MKAARVLFVLAAAAVVAPPAVAQQKTVTVFVWPDEGVSINQEQTPARVEATRSLRLANATQRYRQKFTFSPPNKYVLTLDNAPKSIDIGIDLANCHSLALCDLTGDQDHSLHVRMFSLVTPLAAPECFALKTQYEFLFRREQQFAGPPIAPRLGVPPGVALPRPGAAPPPVAPRLPPGVAPPRIARARPVDGEAPGGEEGRGDDRRQARRRAVQHAARLKYADGLLALPNPNRPRKTQSPATQAMLDRMEREDEDGYNELENMVDGLFDLYGMMGFEQYVPSRWQSRYWVGGRAIEADIEILGTHGTYRTNAGLHRLENIDFLEDDEEGGYIITGNFRFKPGTPDEQIGEIRWKVDEQGFRETRSQGPNGQPSWAGTLQSGPHFPE
jgi:hypothetical protein